MGSKLYNLAYISSDKSIHMVYCENYEDLMKKNVKCWLCDGCELKYPYNPNDKSLTNVFLGNGHLVQVYKNFDKEESKSKLRSFFEILFGFIMMFVLTFVFQYLQNLFTK